MIEVDCTNARAVVAGLDGKERPDEVKLEQAPQQAVGYTNYRPDDAGRVGFADRWTLDVKNYYLMEETLGVTELAKKALIEANVEIVGRAVRVRKLTELMGSPCSTHLIYHCLYVNLETGRPGFEDDDLPRSVMVFGLYRKDPYACESIR